MHYGTLFEHFKAELEHSLRQISGEIANRIMKKIDIDWTDMLWRYRGDDNIIDDEFLRYFRFICDIICYQEGGTTQGKSDDVFDLLDEYFSPATEHVGSHIEKLENWFDCWCRLPEASPTAFLEKFISHEHEAGKIRVENRYELDIFADCLQNYADIMGNGNRSFPLGRIILLYAIVIYLEHWPEISEEQFARRLRIVNNLIQNSEDEISDSENRSTGNRMPTILKHVEEIIRTGEVRLDYERSLNPTQLQEEVDKLNWLSVHPEYSEDLFALEDHELLQGQISIVGLEHPEHFARFEKLFACDWDKVDCALMSIGFYGQQEKNRTHYQLGTKSKRNTKAWRSLFHRSNKSVGFDETKRILAELLSSTEEFNDTYLDNMAATYLDSCEQQQIYPWRYYYIKYDFFRPGSYGKYTWENYAEAPYHFSVMMTERKWSENTYQPFLRAIDESKLSREDMGQRLRLGNRFIVAENGGIVLYDEETRQELVRVHVPQNEDKIDVENRVESLKKAYTTMI